MQSNNLNSKVVMAAPPDRTFWELIGFAAFLGLFSKIAILAAKRNLNWKEKVRDFVLAVVATFLIINVCLAYEIERHFAACLIAVSARYSDAIILLIFNSLKNVINKFDPFE